MDPNQVLQNLYNALRDRGYAPEVIPDMIRRLSAMGMTDTSSLAQIGQFFSQLPPPQQAQTAYQNEQAGTTPYNIGEGYQYLQYLVPLLLQMQQQPLQAGQAVGYVPGSYFGQEGMIPTLENKQFGFNVAEFLSNLIGNPRDQAQLDILNQAAGQPGNTLSNALLTTPTTGKNWTDLMGIFKGLTAQPQGV